MSIRILILVLIFPSLCLAGGNLYVATTGTDSAGCGAIGSPCATIQYTITNKITDANGGWNIYLRGGTYHEHDITIAATKTGTSGAWNTMQSYAGEWAIIDGQRQNTGNTTGLIENLDGFYHAEADMPPAAQYWKFERLEITGGGTTASDSTGGGIWWVKGPITVRYCYIHDNLVGNACENPQGMGGSGWQGNTIEYNYFDHNGSVYHGVLAGDSGCGCNTTSGPAPEASWEYNGDDVEGSIKIYSNTIQYNLIKTYGEQGIRTKASGRNTTTRNGSETVWAQLGDKIHHNIIQNQYAGNTCPSIFWQNDYAQIYQNIVDMTSATTGVNGDESRISTRRIRTWGVDTLKAVVYNNTIINSPGDAIGARTDNQTYPTAPPTTPYWYVYNNLIDNQTDSIFGTIAWGCSAGWCDDSTGYNHAAMAVTNMNIDRNYIYRTTGTDAVYIGNATWDTGLYTYTEWETAKSGANLYKQAYNAGNLLYQNTTGADKYRVRPAHTVEGATTIANGGIGGNHPYITGVTLPSYIGAANPSDDNWVAGVLALGTSYFTSQANGSTPSWVEGATSATVTSVSGCSIVGGSIK